MSYVIRCFDCRAQVDKEILDSCPRCGGLLTVEMDFSEMRGKRPGDLPPGRSGVWRYAPFLPADATRAISIQEGGTPLYDCRALAKEVGP